MNIAAVEHIFEKGFLDIEPDPSLDLFSEIEKLKKEKNAVILAHYYYYGCVFQDNLLIHKV